VPDDVQKNFDAAQKANHSAELGMKLFKEKHPKSVGPAKGADDIEFGPEGGAGRSRRSPELPQRLPQKEKGRKSANPYRIPPKYNYPRSPKEIAGRPTKK
jgi:hypothetical protein